MHKKRNSLLILLIVILIFVVGAVAAYKLFLDPYAHSVDYAEAPYTLPLDTELSGKNAANDLESMVERATAIHPLLAQDPPEAFTAAVKKETAALEARSIVTVAEVWQSAGRIFHALGDAHTFTGVKLETPLYLPLQFHWEGTDLVCREAVLAQGTSNAQPSKVISIGGVPIAELYEQYRSMFSYELESYCRYNFALDLSEAPTLQRLGIYSPIRAPRPTLVLDRNGKEFSLTPTLQPQNPNITSTEQPFAEYTFDMEAKAAIFTLRRCIYNEEYQALVKDFFTEVAANDTQTVIVDLRDNPGGNNQVATEFLRYLAVDQYDRGSSRVRYGPFVIQNPTGPRKNARLTPSFSGQLYALTSTNTFSSATDFAVWIQDNHLGKVVGEISGNLPSSYGDVVLFQAPHSKMIYQVSYKYFTRPDESKLTEPLIPDISVPSSDALASALADASGGG